MGIGLERQIQRLGHFRDVILVIGPGTEDHAGIQDGREKLRLGQRRRLDRRLTAAARPRDTLQPRVIFGPLVEYVQYGKNPSTGIQGGPARRRVPAQRHARVDHALIDHDPGARLAAGHRIGRETVGVAAHGNLTPSRSCAGWTRAARTCGSCVRVHPGRRARTSTCSRPAGWPVSPRSCRRRPRNRSNRYRAVPRAC